MTKSEHKEIVFTSTKARKIQARFDGGTISSDARMLLVREADKRLRLCKTVSRQLPDERESAKVEHSILKLLQQRAV